MIRVTETVSIDESEIQVSFTHASGPGGQNVNKVATAVQLCFDVCNSPSLPAEVRSRLMQLAGKRLTRNGILVIDARRFRTQAQNRQDAIDRLVDLVRKAAQRPKRRRKTQPSAEAKRRRRDAKRRRGEVKRLRRRVPPPT